MIDTLFDLPHIHQGELHQVTAYDSVVTVVEPEVSLLDYQVYAFGLSDPQAMLMYRRQHFHVSINRCVLGRAGLLRIYYICPQGQEGSETGHRERRQECD